MSVPELQPFQKRVVERCKQHHYSIVGVPMGGGKSPITLVLAKELKARLLVICPAYLREKWRYECRKFWPESGVVVFHSDKLFDLDLLVDTDVVIIGYPLANPGEEKIVQKNPLLPKLFRWANICAIDEAHYLKNLEAKRTISVHKEIFESEIPRVVMLTGTPIQNGIPEFYSLLRLASYSPKRTNGKDVCTDFPDQIAFNMEFTNRVEREVNGRIKIFWEGKKNVPKLKEYLKDKYFYVSEEELGLVGQQEIFIPTENIKDCEELRAAFDLFISTEENRRITPQLKVQSALEKVPFTIKYIKDLLDSGEIKQVVVFSDHPDVAERIAEAFNVPAITGDMPVNKRQTVVDAFRDGAFNVLPATFGSASVGFDMISTNHMVINDWPWVPGILDQGKGRIRRFGQLKICFYHYILGTRQDEYIVRKLTTKRNIINSVTKD